MHTRSCRQPLFALAPHLLGTLAPEVKSKRWFAWNEAIAAVDTEFTSLGLVLRFLADLLGDWVLTSQEDCFTKSCTSKGLPATTLCSNMWMAWLARSLVIVLAEIVASPQLGLAIGC